VQTKFPVREQLLGGGGRGWGEGVKLRKKKKKSTFFRRKHLLLLRGLKIQPKPGKKAMGPSDGEKKKSHKKMERVAIG